MAGISLSLAIFVMFLVVTGYIHFHIERRMAKSENPDQRWKRIFPVLYVHMILLMIRSVFRVAEFSEGYGGYLAVTEGYGYGLDVLMVMIVLAIWIPFNPAYLGFDNEDEVKDVKAEAEDLRTSETV